MSFGLNIGGIQIGFTLHDQLDYGLYEHFRPFLYEAAPQVKLNLHHRSAPEISFQGPTFDSGASWSLAHAPGQWLLRVKTAQANPSRLGIFSEDMHTGDLYLTPGQTSFDYPPYGLDPFTAPFGEIFYFNLLSRGYGAVLHAFGLQVGESGIVFSGRSGTGKTTSSRLWHGQPGVRILNDERVILREQDGEFWIYGSPWTKPGGLFSNGKAPLRAIYFLRHGACNQITPLKPIEIVTRVSIAGLLPHWDAAGMAYTLSLYERMAQRVPGFEFQFLPDPSAVETIRQHMIDRC